MCDDDDDHRHVGYQGGDGEDQLIAAWKRLQEDAQTDAVTKLKTVYWQMGQIYDTAQARGYTAKLGAKGWCRIKLDCSTVWANHCRNAWNLRHSFDTEYQWYLEGNSGWVPTKSGGPEFHLELHKAYLDRGKTDAEKLAASTRRKEAAKRLPTAMKQLRRQAGDYRQWAERLLVLVRKLNSEHPELKVIETEMREAEADKPAFSNGSGTEAAKPGVVDRSLNEARQRRDRHEPKPEPDVPLGFLPSADPLVLRMLLHMPLFTQQEFAKRLKFVLEKGFQLSPDGEQVMPFIEQMTDQDIQRCGGLGDVFLHAITNVIGGG